MIVLLKGDDIIMSISPTPLNDTKTTSIDELRHEPLKIFIGYDHRESIAWHTLTHSILRQSSVPVAIVPLTLSSLSGLMTRPRDPKQSNDFSFSRFLVPYLSGYQGYALFLDCDMMLRTDIAELFDVARQNPEKALHVVKHDYVPSNHTKYLGNIQHTYPRKNWSSVVLWNCAHEANRVVTPEFVNKSTGMALHRFSWLDDGLKPRAVTRDLDWGIDVPVEGATGKKLYVWFDAPIGYISATKEWAAREGKNWEDYWKRDDTKLVHFIGKDNIVFHCITFPAILKAHENYILPTNVPANEFMNLEGDKISTSRNWAVWLHEYLEDFPGREDELRYALIANMPENRDSEFTWQDFQNRVNSELGNNLGNFVKRVSDLLHKFYDGVVPEYSKEEIFSDDYLQSWFKILLQYKHFVNTSIENFEYKKAIGQVLRLSSYGNEFLQGNEPWKLIKTDEERVKTILNLSLNLIITINHFRY